MTDQTLAPALPKRGSIVANALSFQAVGGAIAIIYAGYLKRHGVSLEQDELQAYSLLFTEGLTAFSLLVHFLFVRFFLPPT